jgi:WD40 repeat protein/tRNA A-37 threonylcarbamoyl transferase component Bud32
LKWTKVMQDLTNTIFRDYRLIRCLGRGTSSSVYLGEHVDLKILVAIKILHTYLSEKEGERFRNEARLITRLDHPNIVAAHAYDIEDGMPFIVMNYAPKGSLRRRYPKDTRLAGKDVIRYVTQVASALQYTHDRVRLIHQDVKPENMLLGPNDEVWLSDFGVSLIMPLPDAQPLPEIAGTIRYMAPEQIRGKPCFASDQYALGVVVYEWLSGSPPFTGSSVEIPNQHLHLPPPSLRDKVPTISPAVEEVVLRALAKAPQARFPSVRAFADALQDALEPMSRPKTGLLPSPGADTSASANWQPTLSSQDEPVLSLPAPSVVIQPMAELASSPLTSSSDLAETFSVHTSGLSRHTSALSRPSPSRRSVIVGLTGLAVAIGGGTIAFEHLRASPVSSPKIHPSSTHVRPDPAAVATPAPKKQSTPAPVPGTTLYIYRGHTQAIKSVAWVSDQRVVSGSLDSTVRIWDAITGNNLLVYRGHKTKVEALAASPDDTYIASGDGSGKIHIWDTTTGNDRFAPISTTGASSVRGVSWSPDGHSIANGDDNSIVSIWAIQTGERLFSYRGHQGPIRSVAWSPNGQLLASGSVDKTVQIWSATNRKQQALLVYRGHTDIVWCVAWSPDGTRLASASQDGTVQVWNATTGALIARHVVPAGKAESVAWSPNGQFIAGGSNDGTVQVWNAVTGQIMLSYHQQQSTIWSLAWSPNGQHIASACNDDTVSVWQAN